MWKRVLSTVLFGVGSAGCIPDLTLKLPLAIEAEARDDGWTVSTPAAAGFDEAALREAFLPLFDEAQFPTVFSMLIVRHGMLVAEGYVRDRDDIDEIENIKSATKSFTSVLLGIAIDQGLLSPDLDVPLSTYLPEAFAGRTNYLDVTLRHALTMQTGIAFSNDAETNVLRGDRYPDSVGFILDLPKKFEPGAEFDYHDGNPHLIGAVIEKVSGLSLIDFAQQNLFGPLGIERFHWDAHVDGLAYGAFGIYLRPRDLARFGQMMLERGTYAGRRIVSEAWLDEAMRTQVERPDGWNYGYYFWVNESLGYVAARGHGGQRANIVDAHDLLVVLTAEPTVTGDRSVPQEDFEALVDAVIAAIREP